MSVIRESVEKVVASGGGEEERCTVVGDCDLEVASFFSTARGDALGFGRNLSGVGPLGVGDVSGGGPSSSWTVKPVAFVALPLLDPESEVVLSDVSEPTEVLDNRRGVLVLLQEVVDLLFLWLVWVLMVVLALHLILVLQMLIFLMEMLFVEYEFDRWKPGRLQKEGDELSPCDMYRSSLQRQNVIL